MHVDSVKKDGKDEEQRGNFTLDEALEISGSLKRIQLLYQLFFLFIIAFTFYQSLLSVFAGDSPAWRCTNNSTLFCRQNIDQEIKITNKNFSKRCELKREEWVYVTPNSYSYVTEFDLVCKRNYISALIGGSFFMGLVVAAIVCGTISDVYGRKKVYTIFLLFAVTSSIATSYANNAWLLLVLRFTTGLSCSAGWAFSATYLAELIPPKLRPVCINGSNFAFPLASLFLCGVAYAVPRWRDLQLYLSLVGLLPLAVCLFVPESPYWLVSVGRHVEAENIVRKIARWNGREFGKNVKLKREKLDDLSSTTTRKKYTYLDLFKQVKFIYVSSSFIIKDNFLIIFNYSEEKSHACILTQGSKVP